MWGIRENGGVPTDPPVLASSSVKGCFAMDRASGRRHNQRRGTLGLLTAALLVAATQAPFTAEAKAPRAYRVNPAASAPAPAPAPAPPARAAAAPEPPGYWI